MNSLFRQIRKYFILGLIVVVIGCDTSNERHQSTFGLNYYPLKTGNYWIYSVNEVKYDTTIQNITSNYQERFEIVDQYVNSINEMAYVLHRSIRADENSPWTFSQTWTARISALNEVLVSEENIIYLKILLPVSKDLSWKGNKYNTIESTRTNNRIDTYLIKDLGKEYNSYSRTFTVQESDEKNFSYEDLRYSIYAENVGMVYRVNKYIEFCDDAFCFGLSIRKHEVTKIETLIYYGVQ